MAAREAVSEWGEGGSLDDRAFEAEVTLQLVCGTCCFGCSGGGGCFSLRGLSPLGLSSALICQLCAHAIKVAAARTAAAGTI